MTEQQKKEINEYLSLLAFEENTPTLQLEIEHAIEAIMGKRPQLIINDDGTGMCVTVDNVDFKFNNVAVT